jgi:hypothetical protein
MNSQSYAWLEFVGTVVLGVGLNNRLSDENLQRDKLGLVSWVGGIFAGLAVDTVLLNQKANLPENKGVPMNSYVDSGNLAVAMITPVMCSFAALAVRYAVPYAVAEANLLFSNRCRKRSFNSDLTEGIIESSQILDAEHGVANAISATRVAPVLARQ